MFVITLSRPRPAIEALGIGILVTLTVGVAVGRLTSYQFGAVGVLLGGLALFVAIAHVWLQRMLARADYYYYSSFCVPHTDTAECARQRQS